MPPHFTPYPPSIPPKTLSDLISTHSYLTCLILVANLTPEKTHCPGCKGHMCDYHFTRTPHVCDDELECEMACQMIECKHIYGQECLLRHLDKWGKCPICMVGWRAVMAEMLLEMEEREISRFREREAGRRAIFAERDLGIGEIDVGSVGERESER